MERCARWRNPRADTSSSGPLSTSQQPKRPRRAGRDVWTVRRGTTSPPRGHPRDARASFKSIPAESAVADVKSPSSIERTFHSKNDSTRDRREQFSAETQLFYVDELISEGLCVFTDLDDDHGTLDLDKWGEEARQARASAHADRRLPPRERRRRRGRRQRRPGWRRPAAAAARRQEEERSRVCAGKTDARGKRRTANGKAQRDLRSRTPKSNVSKSNAKRAAERSEPNDSGAEMPAAAAALMASGERTAR